MNSHNREFTITGHMVVKNEDRWVWFSIMSVIDFLDKLIIFDTGSRDKTNEIIKQVLKNEAIRDKIEYQELGSVTPEAFHKIRQKQIDMTTTDYFMVVDGDEIWYRDSLEELGSILSEKHPDLVATRFINCCEDVFHYRNDDKETYCIAGIKGSITIRVYSRTIPGICCGGVYGVEGYIDENGNAVQEGNYHIAVQEGKYLHTSLLNRSSLQYGDYSIPYRRSKLRAHWDKKFSPDYQYPEVFYQAYPAIVRSPFEKDWNLIRTLYSIAYRCKQFFKTKGKQQ